MGYERKRGKLTELNALLRGGSQDRFSSVIGHTEVLSTVKYVITLDTDTQLPENRGSDGVRCKNISSYKWDQLGRVPFATIATWHTSRS